MSYRIEHPEPDRDRREALATIAGRHTELIVWKLRHPQRGVMM